MRPARITAQRPSHRTLSAMMQRYKHEFQTASGSREMVEYEDGDWVRWEEVESSQWVGRQIVDELNTRVANLEMALRKATLCDDCGCACRKVCVNQNCETL